MNQRPSRGATNSTPCRVAGEIYTLCFPLLLMDAVRRAHPTALRQFMLVNADGASLAPGLTEDDPRIVITSAWVNLLDGPVVLDASSAHGRHHVLNAIDTAGRSFLCVNAKHGLKLALASSQWAGELPEDIPVKRSPSTGCWIVSRIHANSLADRRETLAIARKQSLELIGRTEPPITAFDPTLDPGPLMSLREVIQLSPRLLFKRLDQLLARAPIGPLYQMRPRVTELRERLGGPPDASEWTAEFHDEIARGCAEAAAAIADAAKATYRGLGEGWVRTITFEEAVTPLERAACAFAGLGALPRRSVLTVVCQRDQFGELLTGGNAYRIRFGKGDYPPALAFWEIYARPPSVSQTRIGVGSRENLQLEEDGAIQLTIQHEAPTTSSLSNWLPSPRGAFSLIMHMHSPSTAALAGDWSPPRVERLGIAPIEQPPRERDMRPWRSPLHAPPRS